jgi:hypothetical protein
MDPFITVSILVVLVVVIGGVWGWTIISELMRARTLRLQPPSVDPRIEELADDHRRLEDRLEKLEEEVEFFRELRAPEDSRRLAVPEDDAPQGNG